LIVIEGVGVDEITRDDMQALRALAVELAAEIWLSVATSGEQVSEIPESVKPFSDLISVVLALEPSRDGNLALRALKDHDNEDLSALHVALDPQSLLLVRN
jgi:hypothetical protein